MTKSTQNKNTHNIDRITEKKAPSRKKKNTAASKKESVKSQKANIAPDTLSIKAEKTKKPSTKKRTFSTLFLR